MADKRANLLLYLKDMASAGIDKVSGSMGSLKRIAGGVTVALGAIAAVLVKSLDAYGQQERAIAKLNQGLENQGIKSEAVTKDLIRFAAELQSTTTIADETAIEVMALGTTFGLTGDKLKETTKAAADLSAGMGMDLKNAMLLLGKAAVGETGSLSRYGIIIGENIPKTEKFAEVLRQVNSRFGGSAQAEADTYSGRLTQLKNTFGDLMETVGSYVVGPATAFIVSLKESIQLVNQMISVNNGMEAATRKVSASLQRKLWWLEKLAAVQEKLAWIAGKKGIEAVQERIRITKERIAWLDKETKAIEKKQAAEAAQAGTGKVTATVEADPEIIKLKEKSQARIDILTKTEEELQFQRDNAMQRQLNAAGLYEQEEALRDARITKRKEEEGKKRAQAMSQTLATISTLSNSHNKTLAAAGKAAAITTATIDTFSGVGKAWALGPILGPPMAALVAAAGMMNVAKISGVKLAEGGMLMPSSGGTMATMAEAGKPEVAIPLDDERTKEKLRDTLGGGGVIIQAGVIIADEYSIEQFAQKIDEKLYGLQRNRRSVL